MSARTPEGRPRTADHVESPCIGVCVVDERSGWCEGCLRSLDEIAAWPTATPDERRRILGRLGARRRRWAGGVAR